VVEITSRKEFADWLKIKPRAWAEVLAVRSALRVLPSIVAERETEKFWQRNERNLGLAVFRACHLVWLKPSVPSIKKECIVAAANDAFKAAFLGNVFTENIGYATACAAANTATYAATLATDVDANTYAAYVEANTDTGSWEALSNDCKFLMVREKAVDLAYRPLWSGEKGIEVRMNHWTRLKKTLHGQAQDWQVWIEWYEDRVQGRPFNQGLEEAIANFDPDFWKKGPAVVNARIVELRAEFLTPLQQPEFGPGDTRNFTDNDWQSLDQKLAADQRVDEYFPVVYRNPSMLTINAGFENKRSVPDELITDHLQSLSELLDDLLDSWSNHSFENTIPERIVKTARRLFSHSKNVPKDLNSIALARCARLLKEFMKRQMASMDCCLNDDEIAYIKNIVAEAEEIQKAYPSITKFKREEAERAAAFSQELVDSAETGMELAQVDQAIAEAPNLDDQLREPLFADDRPYASLNDEEKRSLLVKAANKLWNLTVAIKNSIANVIIKEEIKIGWLLLRDQLASLLSKLTGV